MEYLEFVLCYDRTVDIIHLYGLEKENCINDDLIKMHFTSFVTNNDGSY